MPPRRSRSTSPARREMGPYLPPRHPLRHWTRKPQRRHDDGEAPPQQLAPLIPPPQPPARPPANRLPKAEKLAQIRDDLSKFKEGNHPRKNKHNLVLKNTPLGRLVDEPYIPVADRDDVEAVYKLIKVYRYKGEAYTSKQELVAYATAKKITCHLVVENV